MDTTQNVGGRDRLVRLVLTVVLSIVAVRWLKRGKRLRGLLAGGGALGLGFTATTKYCGVNDALGINTAEETADDAAVEFETDDASTGSEAEDEADEPAAAPTAQGSRAIHCAACGEPIVPGQSRGPNEHDEIVHDDCR